MPTLEDIRDARRRIAEYVHRTPQVSSRSVGEVLGTPVSLKLEVLQKTGSFKPRGAFNQVLGLSDRERAAGVVGVSGGNYAQGLAFAGQRLGVATRILMPENTPENYVQATRGYGAVVEFAPDMASIFTRAEELRDGGLTFLHPFDDLRMMAGNGTIGLEVLEDAPDVTDVFVSIGGGGLMTGIAAAIKEQRPGVRIWGVETVGADAMSRAMAAGEIVEIEITSIAKTLGAPWVSEDTLAAAGRYLEDVIVVEDAEAFAGIEMLMHRAKVVVEPAAGCTLAAAQRVAGALGSHVVLILCGGNVSLGDLTAWGERFGSGA
ncbi:MAG: threonine/serine dehydratase [Actinobacteria bacterium]|nr:threonine/serine dehydratase [Actinomycetota bacterium]MBU1494594.1 threonine/serine dehydratase [Actinomycetota bacterium]MBU1865273.1 threonine/serine dehydratase [Actinomycetota bacterium]